MAEQGIEFWSVSLSIAPHWLKRETAKCSVIFGPAAQSNKVIAIMSRRSAAAIRSWPQSTVGS